MKENILDQELRDQINKETGQLGWQELQRYFARGVVVKVSAHLDLVEVASRLVNDDKAMFEEWLKNGQIARATEDDARDWNERNMNFWAVVVAPWVLVQEAINQ